MAQIVTETVQTDTPQVDTLETGTPEASTETRQIHRARERVRAIRGFYIHAGVFVIVNLGIFIANAVMVLVSPGQNWFFQWPLLAWGVALVINGFVVFTERFLGPDWEERKVREYLARQK